METETTSRDNDKKEQQGTEEEQIQFLCKECGMSELVHFYGKKPPFTRNIEFQEDSYVMKDPFTAPPSRNGKRSYTEYFIVVGCKCRVCNGEFCKDCSVFYDKSFCYRCAHEYVTEFPLEIQCKIRKEFLAIKNRRK